MIYIHYRTLASIGGSAGRNATQRNTVFWESRSRSKYFAVQCLCLFLCGYDLKMSLNSQHGVNEKVSAEPDDTGLIGRRSQTKAALGGLRENALWFESPSQLGA